MSLDVQRGIELMIWFDCLFFVAAAFSAQLPTLCKCDSHWFRAAFCPIDQTRVLLIGHSNFLGRSRAIWSRQSIAVFTGTIRRTYNKSSFPYPPGYCQNISKCEFTAY